MVLTDPFKHGTEWGCKIIYSIYIISMQCIMGFSYDFEGCRFPTSSKKLKTPWNSVGAKWKLGPSTTNQSKDFWVSQSLTAKSNFACVLLYCLNHVVNTVPLLLRRPLWSCFFCETYHVLLWLWMFYISIQLHPTCPRQLGHHWNFVSMK